MTRLAALLAALLVTGCGRPPAEREPDTNTASFDNVAASQSIMQPRVVAENPPEPIPSSSPTAATPRIVTIAFARRAVLDEAGRAAVEELVSAVPGDARLVVRGHSDSSGSDAANLAHSRRRAETVRAYLVEKGVAPARIEVIALGERRPVAPNADRDGNDDPAGRARNRRVEIEILPPDPTPSPAAPDTSPSPARD